jgi:hypothetical protein
MIKSIKFVEGFTVNDIYKNSDKEMHFTSGLNAVFSGNGSGKSVALKFLKSYCSIPVGGWTQVVDPKTLAPDPFPHCYRAFTPDKDRVVVDWDGTPVFYNAGDISDNNAWFFQAAGNNSEDGLSTEAERFDTMTEKPSSGQYRLKQINKILNVVKNPPNYNNANPKLGDVSEQLEYLNSLPKDGKITMLLDEPERSLSLPKQKKLLEVLLELSKDYQIIMACHSPFILDLPREQVNIIEIEKGYTNECDQLFNFRK